MIHFHQCWMNLLSLLFLQTKAWTVITEHVTLKKPKKANLQLKKIFWGTFLPLFDLREEKTDTVTCNRGHWIQSNMHAVSTAACVVPFSQQGAPNILFLFKWGEARACLFMTNCVGIDVVLLRVLSHAQHMHYAFVVLSGFLSKLCWHREQNDLSRKKKSYLDYTETFGQGMLIHRCISFNDRGVKSIK